MDLEELSQQRTPGNPLYAKAFLSLRAFPLYLFRHIDGKVVGHCAINLRDLFFCEREAFDTISYLKAKKAVYEPSYNGNWN